MEVATVDLFAGAGGLSVGATSAGADVRLLIENDPTACDTLRANPDSHNQALVLEADVETVSGQQLRELCDITSEDSLLIVGGAPCQPFSKAAYWTDPGVDARFRRARSEGRSAPKPEPILVARPDSRRTLVDEYWRLVVESEADAFLFENVPSILHPRNRRVIESLQARAKRSGYQTILLKANAAEYGVPQMRQRVFLLGSRAGTPIAPKATHYLGDDDQAGRLPAMTTGEALAAFAAEEFAEPEEVVTGRWASELTEIPPGWNYKYLTDWAGHSRPTFVAETRFWNFLLKLSPERPSWTIAASPGPWTGPFHWENRRLRTIELAALQGFPEGYVWLGNRRERVRQVGNAVPPPLARPMVEALLNTFEKSPEVSDADRVQCLV